MHAALTFLLVLTIHRCYPAGVPRFLQGNLIRRQIRNYSQTLCILWTFAILITLPLFSITKYDTNLINVTIMDETGINASYSLTAAFCYAGATEIWSRTYLILLLVLTYLITGIFLIVIYGRVIRIILASNKYTKAPIKRNSNASDPFRLTPTNKVKEPNQKNLLVRMNERSDRASPHTYSTSSSNESNRLQQKNSPKASLAVSTTIVQNDLNQSPTAQYHSTQHIQVIVMVFIVIILYILLLLPYRLLNLLFIVHNKLFQQTFMNELLFQCLINTVRLLVFLNCALQPLICLRISSRLRQTVVKLLQSWYKCYCYCRFSLPSTRNERNYQDVHAYLPANFQNPYRTRPKAPLYRDNGPLQSSINNINLVGGHPSQRQLSTAAHANVKNRYAVAFNSGARL